MRAYVLPASWVGQAAEEVPAPLVVTIVAASASSSTTPAARALRIDGLSVHILARGVDGCSRNQRCAKEGDGELHVVRYKFL